MALSATDRIHATHATNVTRRLAESVNASFVEGAVAVCSAADHTLLFQANSFQTTVVILSAFRGHFATFHVRISSETARARAHRDMVRWHAGCSSAASAAHGASVDTAALNAGLLRLAIGRSSAARDAAFVGANLTTGAVVVHGAFGRWLYLLAK